jgi:hypothetical protein
MYKDKEKRVLQKQLLEQRNDILQAHAKSNKPFR